MRVGIYGTARNEAANLRAWLDSTAGADCVVLNDTGSTDDTYALAQADPRVIASQLPVEPMLLCNALNIAMRQLPDDIDLAIRLDLDERLQPGWRDELERIWAAHSAGPLVVFPWYDHAGNTIWRHTRIHTPGFRWDLPVHEILIDPAGVPVMHGAPGITKHVYAEMTIEHHPDPLKDRSQVLQELLDALDADPDNIRLQHYLAREYTYRADWGKAIPLLRQHAVSVACAEERGESWRLLGECYCALMPIEDVPLSPYRNAAHLDPSRREGWVRLADLCHQQGRWLECLEAAEHALTITQQNWHFNWAFAWNGMPEHLAALAAWNLGKSEDAARYGQRAVELDPDNDLYAANLAWYSVKEPVNG